MGHESSAVNHLPLCAMRYACHVKCSIYFTVALCAILLIIRVFATQAIAADSPDELYRKGRFAEAEEGYARLDMDHPKDIRYRYNRGCAAFQNSDLQGALAAFSSVVRRATDDDLRFKATFNLGNIAYKQSEFESAAALFKQAIVYNPASEDARYNLELALRELEKQKKDASDEQKTQHPKDEGDSQDEEGGQKAGEQDSGSDAQPQQEESSEEDTSQAEEKTQSGPEEESKAGDDSRAAAEQQDSSRDLTGELEGLRGVPEDQGEEQASGSVPIDRKKAEALLDNIQEDRSRFLRFQVPKEKRYGVESGKDW